MRARDKLGQFVPLGSVTFAENGWMTERVMIQYLRWLRVLMGPGPLALVLDTFPGYITQRVKWQARKMEVELIEVPRGMTGRFQPLDRSCFGPLKKMSEALCDRRNAEQPGLHWSHAEGARLLEQVWPMLTGHTVVAGWNFLGDAIVEATPEDSGCEDPENGEFRVSDDWSDCADPPSDGALRALQQRLAVARALRTRNLAPPPEIGPDFHELSWHIDDEEGFLAEEEARGGAPPMARARGRVRTGRGRG
jgi:hypothetical protein